MVNVSFHSYCKLHCAWTQQRLLFLRVTLGLKKLGRDYSRNRATGASMLSSLPRQSLDTLHWYNSPSTACPWGRPGLPLTSGTHEGQLCKESSLCTQVTCLLCSLLCTKESNPGPHLSLARKHITATIIIKHWSYCQRARRLRPKGPQTMNSWVLFQCTPLSFVISHCHPCSDYKSPYSRLTFCCKDRSLWAVPFPDSNLY